MDEMQANSAIYDAVVFDGARDLANTYGQNITGLRQALLALGITDMKLLQEVATQQLHPDYFLDTYRGKKCDEGVVEAVKECLRPLYYAARDKSDG